MFSQFSPSNFTNLSTPSTSIITQHSLWNCCPGRRHSARWPAAQRRPGTWATRDYDTGGDGDGAGGGGAAEMQRRDSGRSMDWARITETRVPGTPGQTHDRPSSPVEHSRPVRANPAGTGGRSWAAAVPVCPGRGSQNRRRHPAGGAAVLAAAAAASVAFSRSSRGV